MDRQTLKKQSFNCRAYASASSRSHFCHHFNKLSKIRKMRHTFFIEKYPCVFFYGTIHLRRQHVLGGEGFPHVPMVQRSQYIRIKNSLHKHFAGMPMVGGQGLKIVKICRRLKWMVPYSFSIWTKSKYNFKSKFFESILFFILEQLYVQMMDN